MKPLVRLALATGLLATLIVATGIAAIELMGGREGGGYHLQLPGSGGVPPYRWEVIAGELPPGVSLDQGTGVLAGTFTKAGDYGFTIRLTDANGQRTEEQVTLRVAPPQTRLVPLEILSETLPRGVKGVPYVLNLATRGGVPPLSCSVSGTLPEGLQFDPNTCGITGTPTEAAKSTITVLVKDSQDVPAEISKNVDIVVESAGVAWWWIVLATVGGLVVLGAFFGWRESRRCPDCGHMNSSPYGEGRICNDCGCKWKVSPVRIG